MMELKIKYIFMLGLLLALLSVCGCAALNAGGGSVYNSNATQAEDTPFVEGASDMPIIGSSTDAPTATPTSTQSETSTGAIPRPEPTPQTACLGFAGDLLLMTGQIEAAFDRQTGKYDFTDSFAPMRTLFESVDMTLINFEGTLAGEEAGYTQPRPTALPSTEEELEAKRPVQRFNAPDAIVENLMALGVDGFPTANNHCLDMGVEGLLRTISVMEQYGAFHTGSYLDEEDASAADIVELNGIRIGFVSCTYSVNRFDGYLDAEQTGYMVNRLYNAEMMEEEFRSCREQGADIIVALPHWGSEYELSPNSTQLVYAKKLIQWGADIIIGSHPHVIQPIEWVKTERDGVTVTVPVVYSLGNFVSNISRSHNGVDIGLFVSVELTRQKDGNVEVTALCYTPLYDITRYTSDGRYLHEVIPCFKDTTGIATAEALPGIARAFALCNDIIGDQFVLWEDWLRSHESGL